MTRVFNSICPFCGVGCGIGLRVTDNHVVGVEPIAHHPVSNGQLCTKGWNTEFGIDSGNRLTQPLIRERHGFRPASWDEALDLIVDQFKVFLEDNGPESVGIISSARASNEDNYAAQKFARAVLKTNNVDHCARICHSPSVAGLKQTLGSGAMTNRIEDIELADVIMVFGCDPTENHTIMGGRIIRAKLNGKKLIVVDPRKTRLAKLADIHLQLKVGTNIALLNGLIHIIFQQGWENKTFLQQHCTNVDSLKKHVADYSAEKVSQITGVSVELLSEAAKIYAQAQAAWLAYGMGITQFVSGTNNVMAVSNLVLVCGQIGRPGTGINPLRGQNNVQGACDMGALPNVYPGYQAVAETSVREKFAKAWHTRVAEKPGLTSMGMTKAALAEQFRGMIIIGEDPVVTDPDQNHVASALQAMDLLVVVELTLSETAKLADVVLPAASFAEKEGTFTNCERRVQRVHKAVDPPGEALADWQILNRLAKKFGSACLDWPDTETLFNEMASLTPSYSGMTYALLEKHQGLQWPCNESAPLGTPILHQQGFEAMPDRKACLIPVNQAETAEIPDQEYPFYLTTNRLHFHYGCGSMTRKSPLLERETPDGILFMNPEDGEKLALRNHAPVSVSSRRGYIETRVLLTSDMPPGLVTMPYHFKEAPSNQLTNDAQDPVTKMPELKACAVRIEKLPEGIQPRSLEDIKSQSDKQAAEVGYASV